MKMDRIEKLRNQYNKYRSSLTKNNRMLFDLMDDLEEHFDDMRLLPDSIVHDYNYQYVPA